MAYIEQQWEENVRTVEGRILHKKAHDMTAREKRKELLISRGMPICSRVMGVSGECDVVEFRRSDEGITLSGVEGKYCVTPIEYKRGAPKQNLADILQLTAQAMCLEEMFSAEVPEGACFYGETRRREVVEITEELRSEVKNMFCEMHEYYARKYTPKVKYSKSCNACSLKEICLPKLGKTVSVKTYIDQMLKEEEE